MHTAALGGCFLLGLLSPQEALFRPDDLRLCLPEGEPRAVAATLQAQVQAAAWPEEWSVLRTPTPWLSVAGWELWAQLLAAEHASATPDPLRRAALAVLATAQGRSDAAWAHFAAIGAHPPAAAAAIAALLPGVGPHANPGLWPPQLAAGAVLQPALPPASVDPQNGGILWTRMEIVPFAIGAAQVGLVVALEPSGVEITLSHLGGPPVDCSVKMPAPRGFRVSIEYVDWMRQDKVGEPLAVHLQPAGEPVVLWARFEEVGQALPAVRPGPLPAQLREGGLWWIGAAAAADPLMQRVAALTEKLLGIPVELTSHAPNPAESWTGTLVRVPEKEHASWLAQMAGAIEEYLLGDPLALHAGSPPR